MFPSHIFPWPRSASPTFFILESPLFLLLGYARHITYRYNHKSYAIRPKTYNWQYATQLIAENY